jgi:heavy metal translocating P-type ATPase
LGGRLVNKNKSLFEISLIGLSLLSIVVYYALKFTNQPLPYLPLLLATIIAGVPLVWQILRKLIRGNLGADMLAVIALVVAVFVQEYLAAVLVVIMLLSGQVLEGYAMQKASSVLLALASRMPSIAHLKNGEKLQDIAIVDIKIGDAIVVFPHETCPVDGVVIDGHGSMDESYLTGEPYRISKAPGVSVLSGAINGDSMLVVRAEKLSSDSRYSKIMEVMQDAENKKPELRRLGDQIGAIFAPLALIIAGVSWYLSGDIMRFLSVLIIATPCPLLIAVPVAIISAISIAAKRGIIIKDPKVLERLPLCRTAIFDKTGTLTYGEAELVNIITVANIDKDFLLQQVASVERYSKHPLSGAILRKAKELKIALLEAESVSEKPGEGLVGLVKGIEIKVTSRKKLLQNDIKAEKQLPPISAGLECVVLQNGKYVASLQFRDTPRTDGKPFISHLGPNHQFSKIMLVSGDRASEVEYLAKLLDIKETYSSQTPEQKLEIVRRENKLAPTLFMGDGINDAPALTNATVGIAFGGVNAVTTESAGAVIMENTLQKVDELIHISSSMRKILLQSAVGGMALSLVGMGFASFGLITPVMGAIFQQAIDAVAIGNSLRLTFSNNIKTDI